jgi:cephalosporin hydroxylase
MSSIWRKVKQLIANKTYSLKGIVKGHHLMTYRGVPCIKCPFDYVIYQMILNEVRPDLIIEVGTNCGGSALYLADILENIGGGEIHTIDIDDRAYDLVKKNQRIKFFHNGWEGYDVENAWDEGARSNLAKIDRATGRVIKRDDGKVLKPEGWKKPDFTKFAK